MKVYVVQHGEFNYSSEIICICSIIEKAEQILLNKVIGTNYYPRSKWKWVYGMDYYEIIEYTIDECSSNNHNV